MLGNHFGVNHGWTQFSRIELLAVVEGGLEALFRGGGGGLSASGEIVLFDEVGGDVVKAAIVVQEIMAITGEAAVAELGEHPFARRPFFTAQLRSEAATVNGDAVGKLGTGKVSQSGQRVGKINH